MAGACPIKERTLHVETYLAHRWSTLVRTAVLLGCSQADAEDLAQAVCERIVLHWRKVRSADDPDAYVHRMLVNQFRRRLRRRWQGEIPTLSPLDADVAATEDPDAGLDVRRALLALPAEQRMVVVLRYMADLSELSVAGALGIPPGTVKSRAARGLARLNQLLTDEEGVSR